MVDAENASIIMQYSLMIVTSFLDIIFILFIIRFALGTTLKLQPQTFDPLKAFSIISGYAVPPFSLFIAIFIILYLVLQTVIIILSVLQKRRLLKKSTKLFNISLAFYWIYLCIKYVCIIYIIYGTYPQIIQKYKEIASA
jgi:hypothetical protein